MDRRDFLITTGLLGAGLLSSTLAACTPSPEDSMPTEPPTIPPTPTTVPAPDAAPSSPKRVLVAYFSRPGENYYYGDRITLEKGNTEVVAEMIAAAANVDVYRIEAADPYPENYEATVARNVQEENADARPAIANPLPDVAPYDTVLLGSPVWNVQTPMIMRTFVESTNLAGRTIHPFVTYAVSGIGRVENDYAELCPNSTLGESLAVQGEEATEAGADVAAWLRRIGL
jgi:flavodoxin